LSELRERLEREAFAIEGAQRKLQAELARTSDPLERRGIHLKLQRLTLDHQSVLNSIFALDLGQY
jgi:hypothetical protein